MEKIHHATTLSDLQKTLKQYRVPFTEWPAGRIGRLQQEILSGASELFLYDDSIDRQLTTVAIDVCKLPENPAVGISQLVERRRIRQPLPSDKHTVKGRILPAEASIEAVKRCLASKLGIKGPVMEIRSRSGISAIDAVRERLDNGFGESYTAITQVYMYQDIDPHPSRYPGLETQLEVRVYLCVPQNGELADGYSRKRGRRRVTYAWREVSNTRLQHLFDQK